MSTSIRFRHTRVILAGFLTFAFLPLFAGPVLAALEGDSNWFMGRTDAAVVQTVSSSAELVETKYAGTYLYPPAYVLDGKGETTWCPGGRGIGEALTIGFAAAVSFDEIRIVNGFAGKNDLYLKNNRIKTIRIAQTAGKHFQNKSYTLTDQAPGGQSIHFPLPQTAQTISFTIEDIYPGYKYDDTCLSDISFFYQGQPIPYLGATKIIDYQVRMSKAQLDSNASADFGKLYTEKVLLGADGSAWLFMADGSAVFGQLDPDTLWVYNTYNYHTKGNRLVLREQIAYIEATQSILFQPDGPGGVILNGLHYQVKTGPRPQLGW